MKKIIKISLILLLLGMAVIAAVLLKEKEQRESMRMNLRTYRKV